MHKLRLLLLLGLMFAVGGTLVARGQDGTVVFGNQDQKSDSKHEKTKNKTNDGHRRHWWSPPHWFHKKHDSAASGKGANKTVATKNQPVGNQESKTVATTKPASSTTAAAVPVKKTATAHPGAKTGATMSHRKNTVAGAGRKKTAAATQNKKTVKSDCTPEQAKKGGCRADQGSTQKGSAPSSPGKSS